jgi:hypothetical protein
LDVGVSDEEDAIVLAENSKIRAKEAKNQRSSSGETEETWAFSVRRKKNGFPSQFARGRMRMGMELRRRRVARIRGRKSHTKQAQNEKT